MTGRFLLLAAAAFLTISPAAAHDLLVRTTAAPLPQGHPYLVQQDGVIVVYPVPRRPLQFGIVEGRRVLIDPLTMRVVYVLHP